MLSERVKQELQAMPRELLEKMFALVEAAAKRDETAVSTAIRNMTDAEAAETLRVWKIVFPKEGN